MNLDSLTFQFFGRLHPVVLHLPIGLFLGAFALEMVGLVFRLTVRSAVLWLLGLATLSGAAAAVFGLLLSREGGYDEQLLTWHQWLGLALPVVICLCWSLRWVAEMYRFAARVTIKTFYALLICAAVGLTGWVGHLGGSMTHGPDYLTQVMPAWLDFLPVERPVAEQAGDDGSHYAAVIRPILQTGCLDCHSEARQKGGLRLDDIELAMRGGQSGQPAIVPGNAMASAIIRRITLPEDHADFMPAGGKTPLAPDQVLSLIRWIDGGAVTDSAAPKAPEEPAPAEAIGAVRDRGGLAVPIEQDSAWLRVDFSATAPPVTDDDFSLLAPLTAHVAWLDLANGQCTDAIAPQLAKLENLTRLSLQNSAVGDETCAAIAQLEHLQYLNLYNTKVTDAGVEKLHALKKLRQLYLWQTDVSDAALETLREALPKLDIIRGESPAPAESKEAKETEAKPSE